MKYVKVLNFALYSMLKVQRMLFYTDMLLQYAAVPLAAVFPVVNKNGKLHYVG